MHEVTKMKPTKEFREGAVKSAIFEKEIEGNRGRFTSVSVSLQIGYTDRNGKWQNSQISIMKKDLDNVIKVLHDAKSAIEAPN